jgi:ribose-phosphate pyrophosphokinase
MKLFVGSTSQHLGKTISEQSSIPIGKWELVRFEDSEIKPQLQDNVRGEDVVILISTSNPVNENYMELFLLADALRRSACKRIILCMPYYGYARQNQQHLPGESVSAHVVSKMIEAVGIDELITIDLHEEQLAGFFTIPVTHLSALPLLAESVGESILSKNMNNPIIVISPDQGGVERTRKFRDALSKQRTGKLQVDKEIGIVEKLRNLESIHETKFVEITGDIEGKIAVIPDDVIVSGGTVLHAAEASFQKGATAVYLAATHADFIPSTKEMINKSNIAEIVVSDTIKISSEYQFDKLRIVSCSGIISQSLVSLTTTS